MDIVKYKNNNDITKYFDLWTKIEDLESHLIMKGLKEIGNWLYTKQKRVLI